MGLAVLKGRDFTDAEGTSRTAAVSVINNTMARKLWPDAEPVGGRFRLVETEPAEWFTVLVGSCRFDGGSSQRDPRG